MGMLSNRNAAMEGVFDLRKAWMKRAGALLAAVLLLGCGAAKAAPLEEGTPVQIASPSAMLLEADTGTVIFEKNADERRQVASITVPLSIPAAAMICGLTKMIYAIVTKDVIPPIVSRCQVVLRS